MIGIYKITNKNNNKCYIGQSVDIDHRLKAHFSKSNKLDSPLYRAIRKYGKESFETEILETIEFCEDMKSQLDVLEKKYIELYNSYKNGYNQTIGGDAGILGYKFTEEQKRKVSENTRKQIEIGTIGTRFYAYNIYTDEIIYASTITHFASKIDLSRSCCSRTLKNGKITKNGWFLSKELTDIKQRALDCNYKNGKFKTEYKCKFIYKEKAFIGTVKDASIEFGINQSYFYGVMSGARKSNVLKVEKITQ